MFYGQDLDLYDERLIERAKANTSDLNEELGQVSLIAFSEMYKFRL